MKTHISRILALLVITSILMAACAPAAEPTEKPAPPTEVPAATPAEESATDGPRTGEIAPDFALPDSNGNMVRLADRLKDNRFVVLVFYHSHY